MLRGEYAQELHSGGSFIVIGGGGVAPEPEIRNFIVLHFHSFLTIIVIGGEGFAIRPKL